MKDWIISFVVIARNAASTLPRLLEALDAQTWPHDRMEILLVDGFSEDGTRKVMEAYAAGNDFLRTLVLDNPGRNLPSGWNVALAQARGEAVLRVDAHAFFPPEFVALNAAALEKGEDICGGKVISVPARKTPWSLVLNEAENSMFGGSFAAFRHAEEARYVSTAAFAIYRRKIFGEVGPYNEGLTRTEDNEMHYRMKKAGYRFWYDPAIVSWRETRATLGKLLKQKYLNGYWIGRTLAVEPRCFSLYHFVPFCFVLAVLLTAVLALAGFSLPCAALWIAYAAAALGMTAVAIAGAKERNALFLCLPVLFLLLHVSYGFGTLIGILSLIWKKVPKTGDGKKNQ